MVSGGGASAPVSSAGSGRKTALSKRKCASSTSMRSAAFVSSSFSSSAGASSSAAGSPSAAGSASVAGPFASAGSSPPSSVPSASAGSPGPRPSLSSLKVYSPGGTSVRWISPASSVITPISAPSLSMTVPVALVTGWPAPSSTRRWSVARGIPSGTSTMYWPGGLSSMWTWPSPSVSTSMVSPDARRTLTLRPDSAFSWSSCSVKSMASFCCLPAFDLGALDGCACCCRAACRCCRAACCCCCVCDEFPHLSRAT